MKPMMHKGRLLLTFGLGSLLWMTSSAQAQKTTSNVYIGYVYPAGGQQGSTFQIRIGGQRIEGAYGAIVSGEGVQAKLIECRGRMGNQQVRLLREQERTLKKSKDPEAIQIRDRILKKISGYERRPANASIAILSIIEVTIDADAKPGEREIRIMSSRGLSNPLPFYVSQIPEVSRKPMLTAKAQILGNEKAALRKRPESEIEETITLPCVMNGQIASGEVNRYRFKAKTNQRLVISTLARQLVPYIADAVPGWFQPVLTLHDADGKEVAFNDDFRFKPDPTILYKVPKNGEYVLTISDAIYRGREDFVYRITIGELPFITSIYPLGSQTRSRAKVEIDGWNLKGARLKLPAKNAEEGIHLIAANAKPLLSNPIPFMVSRLPENFETEDNNEIAQAQPVEMPVIINGTSNTPGDWDVFKVQAKAGDTIVAEVHARRLDSPLDSVVKLTDGSGQVLAFNDDHADPGSGLNTHHADSYLMAKIQESGDYYIHLADNTHRGGKSYAYRLRISQPRPDFELRTMPSSFHFNKPGNSSRNARNIKKNQNRRGKAAQSARIPMSRSTITVYAIRKDGYTGPITLRLTDAPEGFRAAEVTMKPEQENVKFLVQASNKQIKQPVALTIEGYAKIQDRQVTRVAVPTEDWMQAFLWRHLVPAQELLAHAYNPVRNPAQKPKREIPKLPATDEVTRADAEEEGSTQKTPEVVKKQNQTAAYIRQLDQLYLDWLLTEEFYLKKLAAYKNTVQQN
ncbi:hypothetical protein ACFL6U_22320 [Planctomycetota bacterium]